MLWTIAIQSKKTRFKDEWDEWDEEAYGPEEAKSKLQKKLEDPNSEPSQWYGTDAVLGEVYECPVATFRILGGES